MPLTMVFMLFQIPLLQRHAIADPADKERPQAKR